MLFVAAPLWHIMHTICQLNEFSICETRHIFSTCNWHSKVRLHSNATMSCHASKHMVAHICKWWYARPALRKDVCKVACVSEALYIFRSRSYDVK